MSAAKYGATSCCRYMCGPDVGSSTTNRLHVTICAAMCPYPSPSPLLPFSPSPLLPFSPSPIEQVENSNNDSFGIHSVKVLVQVHYFGVPLMQKLFPF